MDNQPSSDPPLIPNPEIVQPTHNMNNLPTSIMNPHVPDPSLLPQTGLTVANTSPPAFNYQSMISSYDFPDGNDQQEAFQLLESDLPYLEYFLNNPIPDIQRPFPENSSGGISYPGELISKVYETKVWNKMGFGNLKQDRITKKEVLGCDNGDPMTNFSCAECEISFPTGQAWGGHKSYHSKLIKKRQIGRMQPPGNMVEHPEAPPLKHPRID